MNLVALLPFSVLGAVLGLDVVSFPQAQVSRPLVASTLAGALGGAPLAGLIIGATLELIAVETLPVGASRYPEWGSASVVGGALFAASPPGSGGGMIVAVIAALFTGWAGGLTMVWLRQRNAAWARLRRDRLELGSRNTVVRLQLGGMTADLLRGGVLTFAALLLFVPLADWVTAHWHTEARFSRAVVTGTAASVAAGAVWKLFHGTRHAPWYLLAGALVGLLLVRLS